MKVIPVLDLNPVLTSGVIPVLDLNLTAKLWMKKSDTFGYDHGASILEKELMLAHGMAKTTALMAQVFFLR